MFITRTLPRVPSPRRHEDTKTPRRRSVCHGQKQPRRPQSTRSRRREKYPLRSLRSPRILLTRTMPPVPSPRRHENPKAPRRRSVCHGQKQPPRPQSTRSRRREKYPLRSLRSPRFLLTRTLPPVPSPRRHEVLTKKTKNDYRKQPRSTQSARSRYEQEFSLRCLRSLRFLRAGAEIKL